MKRSGNDLITLRTPVACQPVENWSSICEIHLWNTSNRVIGNLQNEQYEIPFFKQTYRPGCYNDFQPLYKYNFRNSTMLGWSCWSSMAKFTYTHRILVIYKYDNSKSCFLHNLPIASFTCSMSAAEPGGRSSTVDCSIAISSPPKMYQKHIGDRYGNPIPSWQYCGPPFFRPICSKHQITEPQRKQLVSNNCCSLLQKEMTGLLGIKALV